MTDVRNLSTGEHNLIGEIIGHSFADDPVNYWIFGNRKGMTGFYTKAAKKLYLQKGFGHVNTNDNGGALWLPPGVKKIIPLWNSTDIAASMIRHSGFASVFRGMATDDTLVKHKPTDPHYYLFAIGTRPTHQGQGLGSRLMKAGLTKADGESMPCYLESSKESNIPFYNNFGFEVIKKVVPTKGCPPLWLMWREARS